MEPPPPPGRPPPPLLSPIRPPKISGRSIIENERDRGEHSDRFRRARSLRETEELDIEPADFRLSTSESPGNIRSFNLNRSDLMPSIRFSNRTWEEFQEEVTSPQPPPVMSGGWEMSSFYSHRPATSAAASQRSVATPSSNYTERRNYRYGGEEYYGGIRQGGHEARGYDPGNPPQPNPPQPLDPGHHNRPPDPHQPHTPTTAPNPSYEYDYGHPNIRWRHHPHDHHHPPVSYHPGSPYHSINYISDIGPNDVLCGRGGATNSNSGNRNFRSVVRDHQERYLNAKKKDKPAVSELVLNMIRNRDPPGRFLKKDPLSGGWYDIGDVRAKEKASQALREGAPKKRREKGGGGGASGSEEELTPLQGMSGSKSEDTEEGNEKEEEGSRGEKGDKEEDKDGEEKEAFMTRWNEYVKNYSSPPQR